MANDSGGGVGDDTGDDGGKNDVDGSRGGDSGASDWVRVGGGGNVKGVTSDGDGGGVNTGGAGKTDDVTGAIVLC